MDKSTNEVVSWTVYNFTETQGRCNGKDQISIAVRSGNHRYDVYGHSSTDGQNDIAGLYVLCVPEFNYLSNDFHYDDIFHK